jgi:hypothetical protein
MVTGRRPSGAPDKRLTRATIGTSSDRSETDFTTPCSSWPAFRISTESLVLPQGAVFAKFNGLGRCDPYGLHGAVSFMKLTTVFPRGWGALVAPVIENDGYF